MMAMIKIRNTSDSADVLFGKSVYDYGYYSQTISQLNGVIALAAEKTIELQYWYSGNNYSNTDALGNYVNATNGKEIYAELVIEKIA